MRKHQKMVDAWISQFKDGYWSDMRILAHLSEELSEVAEELREDAASDIHMKADIEGASFFTEIQHLGASARSFGGKNGKVAKVSEGEDSSLKEEIADLLFSVICLANKHKVDLEEAFRQMMEKKLNGRDKDRFEKKEKE